METKNEIKFDELHTKCIENFPLIVDVMADTIKKLRSILSPYYDETNKYLNEWVKSNKKWTFKKHENATVFPFFYSEYPTQITIKDPEENFEIRNQFNFKNKDNNWLSFHIGFYYANGYFNNNFIFYCGIYSVKEIFGKKFYEKLSKQINNIKIDLEVENEGIEIHSENLAPENIEKVYRNYFDKILIPFLDKLKQIT